MQYLNANWEARFYDPSFACCQNKSCRHEKRECAINGLSRPPLRKPKYIQISLPKFV